MSQAQQDVTRGRRQLRHGLAQGGADIPIEFVARVIANRFEAPWLWEPDKLLRFNQKIETLRQAGDLSDYELRHGDKKGRDRVRLDPRAKGGTLFAPGDTRGSPLKVNQILHVGDAIHIDPTEMSLDGQIPVRELRKEDGLIAVRLEFLDGFIGELRVKERAGTYSQLIGPTGDQSGFERVDADWFYFVAKFSGSQVKDKTIEYACKRLWPSIAPGVSAFNTGKDFFEIISFLDKMENVHHIRIRSQLLIQHCSTGELSLTTREGAPVLYNRVSAPDGLEVPAGKTAIVQPAGPPVLDDTDGETAALADVLLADTSALERAVSADGSGALTEADALPLDSELRGDRRPAEPATDSPPVGSPNDWLETALKTPWILVASSCVGLLTLLIMLAGMIWVIRSVRAAGASHSSRHTVPLTAEPNSSAPATVPPDTPPIATSVPAATAGAKTADAPPPSAIGPHLVDAGGAVYPLTRECTALGSESTNAIVVDAVGVSRCHARVWRSAEGAFWIEDLGSTNGTHLNSRRVEREWLQPEDVITIGHWHAWFRTD